MRKLRKLPEAELEIMKAVWASGSEEITTPVLTAAMSNEKQWTQQTVLTLLRRLEGRGFLLSSKTGKERVFTTVVQEDEYVRFESEIFLKTFHKNSMAGMVRALYDGKELKQEDIDELQRLLDEKTKHE